MALKEAIAASIKEALSRVRVLRPYTIPFIYIYSYINYRPQYVSVYRRKDTGEIIGTVHSLRKFLPIGTQKGTPKAIYNLIKAGVLERVSIEAPRILEIHFESRVILSERDIMRMMEMLPKAVEYITRGLPVNERGDTYGFIYDQEKALTSYRGRIIPINIAKRDPKTGKPEAWEFFWRKRRPSDKWVFAKYEIYDYTYEEGVLRASIPPKPRKWVLIPNNWWYFSPEHLAAYMLTKHPLGRKALRISARRAIREREFLRKLLERMIL
ncbi:MAG: hypothetical protein DRP00_01670 [Candidatus Aenigmatarchaeota archaeon]|nr:MAG: hypothetical protein DRP00_01670 [Candidatus Aenigmarchaeota archaeon]